MAKAPCYQRYPSDFFGDTKVRIMSSDARAYYSLLLDCIWDFDTQYSIPNDDELISKLLVIDVNRWQSFSQEIISCLQVKNGRLVSDRLKREKEKQDKFRKLQSIKGKAGGRPRKSPGLSPASPVESLPLPLPIPIKDKKKKEPVSLEKFTEFYTLYPKHIDKDAAWQRWQKLNPQNGTFEAIMEGLRKQIEWRKQSEGTGVFIPEWPNPSTWLNKGRWKDEVALPQQQGSSGYKFFHDQKEDA